MRHVTGTLISYYFYCKRRMWLHANYIRFEDTSDDDEVEIDRLASDIQGIIQHENCPPLIKGIRCKNCSYYEFCYITEEDEV